MVEEKIKDRLVEYFLKNEIPPPSRIEFNPTNKCNLNCIHCEVRGRPPYRPDDEIPDIRYNEIIKEGIKLGVLAFNIVGGGEPLCRFKTTLMMMNEIKKNGAFGSINTNGTLFTKKSIEKLVEIGWDEIRISIDGPDIKTHDYLRGAKGAFKKVVKNIKLFNYFKNKLKRGDPVLRFTPVIMKQNYNKLEDMIKLSYRLRVRGVFFQPLLIPDSAFKNEQGRMMIKKIGLGEKELKEFPNYLERAKGLAHELDIETNLSFMDELVMKEGTEKIIELDSEKEQKDSFLSIPCFYPWISFHIGTDGSAEPCGGGPTGGPIKHENIKEKNLKEIWYGKSFEQFRKQLMRNQIPSVCKECCVALALDNRKIRSLISEIDKKTKNS